ncbi:MAG: ribonuclease HII [Bacillota bacterium]
MELEQMSVSEIKAYVDGLPEERYEETAAALRLDSRKAVKDIARELERRARERSRLLGMTYYERILAQRGYFLIAGVDEAGRGPLAGPVCAAAVILRPGALIPGLNDSKQLSVKRREELFDRIIREAVAYSVRLVGVHTINKVNIVQASYRAMLSAVSKLSPEPEAVLVDGKSSPPFRIPSVCVVKGDSRSLSIAAASILAKVTRDRYMERYASWYPEYGFERNKGYGTKEHLDALLVHGACPIHRDAFVHVAPMQV